MTARTLSLAALSLTAALAACSETATAPKDAPTLNAGLGNAQQQGLVSRGDSLSKMGYAQWYDGAIQYFVFVMETQMPGTRTATIGYGATDWTNPWWPVTLFLGYGPIPPADVTGSGLGSIAVRTNTGTGADPAFLHENDPGGIVDVTLRQVPQSAFRMHEAGRFEWPPFVFVYNTSSQWRQASAAGTVVGHVLPESVEASLSQAWGHSMVLLTGR